MTSSLLQAQLHPRQMQAQLPEFERKIRAFLAVLGIDLNASQIDHLALRINDELLAQAAHSAWLELGKEKSCAWVNGRPIVVIELLQAWLFLGQPVSVIELPYPAKGKHYPQQGWEHIECVVPSKATTLDEFIEDVWQAFPLLKEHRASLEQQGVVYKFSAPKMDHILDDTTVLTNPSVALKWQGVTLKFHPHTLLDVLESEQSRG